MKQMQTAKYAKRCMQSTELKYENRVCAGNNTLYVRNNKMQCVSRVCAYALKQKYVKMAGKYYVILEGKRNEKKQK